MARRKNIFGFGEKKVTYHRDVAKERRDLRKHLLEEKKHALEARRLRVQEEKLASAEDAKAERERKAERRREDEQDRKIEREMREKGHRNPAKRNPEEAAASLAEAWHGRPAETATDYVEQVHFHGVLTDLGRLLELKVYVGKRHVKSIGFDEETRLASNEDGEQLYVVGGDQSLRLADFGITGHAAQKDCVVVGTVFSVTYVTAKMHLGKSDKQAGPYEHRFKEKKQEEPQLIYDTMNDLLGFAGGEYHIDIDIDGKYSAGIRD